MMVTGDYHYTAIAVARGTGMIPPGRRLVIIQSASEASAATAQPKPAQKAPKPTMTHALASSHGPHVAFADLERRLNALASLQHSSEGEEVQSHHQQPASLHMQPASELQQQQHERVRVGQLHLMLPGPKMPAWRTHEQQAQEVQAWQAGHVTQLPAQHQSAAPQQEQQHLPQLPDDNLKETVSEQGGHVHWSDDHCHLSLPIETSPAGVQKGTLHQPCDHLAEQLVFSQPSHDYHRQHIQSSLSHVYEDDLPVQLSEQADHFRGLTAGLLFLTEGYSPGQEPQTALETVQSIAQGEAQCCVTGQAFQHMLQHAQSALLESVMQHAVVFARMKSHQKGQIMELLSSRGLHQMVHGQEHHIPVRKLVYPACSAVKLV